MFIREIEIIGPNDINALKLITIFTHLKLCLGTATHNKSIKNVIFVYFGTTLLQNSHFVPDNSDLIS